MYHQNSIHVRSINTIGVLISFQHVARALSFEYLCYGSTAIINSITCTLTVRYLFYTSESDVSRRQILTYKDGPHMEIITIFILVVDP